MRKLFQIIFVIITGLMVYSCSKDPVVILPDTCMDFEYGNNECWIGAGPLYTYSNLQFMAPNFNPNNSEEFVYIEVSYGVTPSSIKLFTYNLNLGSKKYLIDNPSLLNQPKWSDENKILYKKELSQIFSIKSNGDSSTQLTYTGLNVDPEWINLSIICYRDNVNLVGVFLNILDFNSDTIESKQLTNADVSSNLVIACTDGGADNPNITISPVDSINWTIITNNTFDSGKDRIMCIQWHPNNEDVYYTKWSNGLYKTNIYTKQEEQILEGCQSRWYKYFSISPDGTKILAERVDAIIERGTTCYITQTSSIVLMNIDGSNEITILPKPE